MKWIIGAGIFYAGMSFGRAVTLAAVLKRLEGLNESIKSEFCTPEDQEALVRLFDLMQDAVKGMGVKV